MACGPDSGKACPALHRAQGGVLTLPPASWLQLVLWRHLTLMPSTLPSGHSVCVPSSAPAEVVSSLSPQAHPASSESLWGTQKGGVSCYFQD